MLKVLFEQEDISVDCICNLPNVNIDDYVEININNKPTRCLVVEKSEKTLDDLGERVFKMKTVVRKLVGDKAPIKDQYYELTSKNLGDSVVIQFTGPVAQGQISFCAEDVKKLGIQQGDKIYFNYKNKVYHGYVLSMKPYRSDKLYDTQISAFERDPIVEDLFNCQYEISNDDYPKVTLKKYLCDTENAVISDPISIISEKAFDRCSAKKVIISSSSLVIEPLAFSGNSSIEEIIVESQDVNIALNAFSGCRKLKHIVLPATCIWMCSDLNDFYGNRNLIEFNYDGYQNIDGVLYSESGDTIVACVNRDIREFTSTFTARAIEPNAFRYCELLESVQLSPMIEYLGSQCFAGCKSLVQVTGPFDSEIEFITLFGHEAFDGSTEEKLTSTEDSSIVSFFIPTNCRYSVVCSFDEALHGVQIESLSDYDILNLASYLVEKYRKKEAISLYSYLFLRGNEHAYRKLVEYSEIDSWHEYFPESIYSKVNKQTPLNSFFHMLSMDDNAFSEFVIFESDIASKLNNVSSLLGILYRIKDISIFDETVFAKALDAIYQLVPDKTNAELLSALIDCSNKLTHPDEKLSWYRSGVKILVENPKFKRKYAFDYIGHFAFNSKASQVAFIDSVEENETKSCLEDAYYSATNPSEQSISLFEGFISKLRKTHDLFYGHCAVMSISTYFAYISQNADKKAQFKSLLDHFESLYLEGFSLFGVYIIEYRKYLKRSTPMQLYVKAAEDSYESGQHELAGSSILNTPNNQLLAERLIAHRDFFTLDEPDNLLMKTLNDMQFCIPAKVISKVPKTKQIPVMYINYEPITINGEPVAFLNIHEAASYFRLNGLPAPEDYYYVPIDGLLKFMHGAGKHEIKVLPRTINEVITDEYIYRLSIKAKTSG